MSKERLEEITLEEIKRFYEGTATVYIKWLIEQAERAEKSLEQTGHNFEVNRKLDAQNKLYRKGLEKIADVENGFHPLAIEARITIEKVGRMEKSK